MLRILRGVPTVPAEGAFVLKRAPSTVGVTGPQALVTPLVDAALLRFHLRDLRERDRSEGKLLRPRNTSCITRGSSSGAGVLGTRVQGARDRDLRVSFRDLGTRVA